jgi:hypothetical protein
MSDESPTSCSFEQAPAAFAEVAALLGRQADLLEGPTGAIRGRAEPIKAVVGVRDRPTRASRKGAPRKPPARKH